MWCDERFSAWSVGSSDVVSNAGSSRGRDLNPLNACF